MVLVAQGMVIQSVAQLVPTMLPIDGFPPVTLNDMAKFWVVCWLPAQVHGYSDRDKFPQGE